MDNVFLGNSLASQSSIVIVRQVIQNAVITFTTLGVSVALASSTLGTEVSGSTVTQSTLNSEKYGWYNPETLTQVTSVSQLSNINNTDWQFQALKSLIQRYGIVSTDLNRVLRSNQSISRYEFAALLRVAIDRLYELMTKENTELVREDLHIIQRLQTELRTELATWERRVDNVEVKTNQLTAQQFSPTAKLTGEVIFALSGARGDEKADDDDEKVDENLIVSDRIWLNLDMSFTGRDRLFVRLEAENTPGFDDATGTDMARLGFEGNSNNKFDISRLEYRFSLNKAANLYITTDSTDIRGVANTTNAFSSSGRGAISRFGRYSPLYRQDFGATVRLKYEFSDAASLSLGVGDDNAEDLDDSELVFDGETDGVVVQLSLEPNDDLQLTLAYLKDNDKYAAIGQLIFEPIDRIKFGLTYLRSYNNLDTNTGSELANDPFDDASDYIITNSYGIETSIRVSSDITLAGWVGLTQAKAIDLLDKPEATIFHYAVTLAFSDLGKEDSLAGIVIGQPPKLTSHDWGRSYSDRDTSLHLEFFYRFQATNSIAITPGLLIVTNPEHNQNNDTIYVGTIRTTFRF